MKPDDIIKTALTEYIKNHNENAGEVTEFFNNLNATCKSFYNLSENIRNDLGQIIVNALALNGIVITNLFNK